MRVSNEVFLTSLVASCSLFLGALEHIIRDLIISLGVVLARHLHYASVFGVFDLELVADLLELVAQHVALEQRVLDRVVLTVDLVHSVLHVLEVGTISKMSLDDASRGEGLAMDELDVLDGWGEFRDDVGGFDDHRLEEPRCGDLGLDLLDESLDAHIFLRE